LGVRRCRVQAAVASVDLLRDEGPILPAAYQRERSKLAERRKAAFATEPTGPHQVWQLDFSEFETATGGTWRLVGCPDYWSKYEHPFHVAPTASQYDAIELALAEQCEVDVETGEIKPVVTIVTDNGGPFRSFRFEAFITAHPELQHVRTRVKTPRQNGPRERGFGTLKYERLFIDEIDNAVMLAKHAEDHRIEYNQIRPNQAIAWNRPKQVAWPTPPPRTLKPRKSCHLLDAGHVVPAIYCLTRSCWPTNPSPANPACKQRSTLSWTATSCERQSVRTRTPDMGF
jgi:transposase InsO family protein